MRLGSQAADDADGVTYGEHATRMTCGVGGDGGATWTVLLTRADRTRYPRPGGAAGKGHAPE